MMKQILVIGMLSISALASANAHASYFFAECFGKDEVEHKMYRVTLAQDGSASFINSDGSVWNISNDTVFSSGSGDKKTLKSVHFYYTRCGWNISGHCMENIVKYTISVDLKNPETKSFVNVMDSKDDKIVREKTWISCTLKNPTT